MHIAAAVGTPAISIFSARALQESWYPYGSNNLVIRKDVPCRFCGLETCIENKNRCLTDITVEEVYDKCRIYLNKYGRLN
jgi:ADP-heptose:LPS heptosyltransferase